MDPTDIVLGYFRAGSDAQAVVNLEPVGELDALAEGGDFFVDLGDDRFEEITVAAAHRENGSLKVTQGHYAAGVFTNNDLIYSICTPVPDSIVKKQAWVYKKHVEEGKVFRFVE